jgi:uncharacterized protein (TIGR02569 family)
MVPASVLTAFGASSAPVRLPGGQGTTWRAGDIVLKPAGDPVAARWTARLYSTLSGPGFRVPRPLAAPGAQPADDGMADGWVVDGWVVDGWVAWHWLPGAAAPVDHWTDLIEVSRAFHAALAGTQAPPWLGHDGSQWTIADQVAWGERDPAPFLAAVGPRLGGQVRDLLGARRPVPLESQLVHGDLAGNVLFADGAPGAVIDFSPYWRPAGLALAVAAVDVLTWNGASPAILGDLDDEPGIDQLLVRAHLGRLVTEIIARGDGNGIDMVEQTARPVTDLLLRRRLRLGLRGNPRAKGGYPRAKGGYPRARGGYPGSGESAAR